MLLDAWQFIRAVFAQWEPLVFGGIPAVAWWLYTKWAKGPSMPNGFFAGLIAFTVLVACFLAWRNERTAAATAKAALDAMSKPQVTIRIEGINVAPDPQSSATKSLYTIFATVTNTGAQSIAKEYQLKVTLPNGTELATLPHYFHAGVTLGDLVGSVRRFDQREHLPDKTATTPVMLNSQVRGVLWFFANASTETLTERGVKVVLSCADVFGTVASYEYIMKGVGETPGHLPGIATELIQPAPPSTEDASAAKGEAKSQP